MAAVITAVVICGFQLVAVINVYREHPDTLLFLATLALLGAHCVLQFAHSLPNYLPWLSRHWRVTLPLQALMVYLPFLVHRQAWLGMPGFLGASALLLLPHPADKLVPVAVVVSIGTLEHAFGFGAVDLVYGLVACVITSLVVYGLSRLSELVAEVHRSRAELAGLAVAEERLRFARDLHDLLGYSLSAITLKSELTRRLVYRQPERAEEELTEILQTARQALADVRAVSRGYRNMSLVQEANAARPMLSSIGIQSTFRLDYQGVPDPVDTVLATVLREGLTNMLRHSRAAACAIEAGSGPGLAKVSITNNGVGQRPVPLTKERGGTGIGNLTTRVEALGGTLRSGVRPDGWFELTAEIPLPAPAA
ncbi:sensor histidine kinase [Kitasatospora sp. NPDC087314]|uniref:sensor histidine kinase n=1 Tax=Kitasatospora sp. NPDC087314 TaxID=3364068 RepID=UPI0037FC2E0D